MAARKAWSKEKEKWLKKLWPKYLAGEISHPQMQKAFDCSRNTINDHARQLGLTLKSEKKHEVNLAYLKELGVCIEV